MENYRLKSKLVENKKEYTIQTSNDAERSAVLTVLQVNGEAMDVVTCPHPAEIDSEEILSLVKLRHDEMKGEIEALLEAYRQVMTKGDARRMYHLGTAFYYKGLHGEALDLFESATQLDSQFHQAYNHLAMTYMVLGRGAEAVKAASTAVGQRPSYADYRNTLGEALLSAESCRRAVIEFEEAIKVNLYYGDAYFNLGLALILNAIKAEDTGLFQQVLSKCTDHFNRAVLISPEYKTDTLEQGLKALRNSDLRGAFNLLKSVRDEKREHHRQEAAAFYMKFVMFPEWVTEEAVGDRISYLCREIEKNPTYVDLYAELGHCHLEMAKLSWQKGLEQFRQVLQMNNSLSKVSGHLDAVRDEYDNICRVLSRIAEKG